MLLLSSPAGCQMMTALTISVALFTCNAFGIKAESDKKVQIRHSRQLEANTSLTNTNGVCHTTLTFPCKCSNSFASFIVNCSRRHLTSVPHHIPERAIGLDLGYNELSTIPAGTFQNLTSLTMLDLSHNKLSRLGSGAFLGLHKLKTLLMNDNYLNMSVSTFSENAFAPLVNLIYLNLKLTMQSDHPEFHYPDVALSKLSSLRSLLINGLSNKTFGKGFRKLGSLITLDLSQSPAFSSISKDTFNNFKHIPLRNLIISHCELVFIHREAFCNLPYIDTIDYSYNKHLELKGVGISTYGLQNSTIRKIVMQRVHVIESLTVITKEDVQYLTKTKLEELHSDNNSIGQVIGESPFLSLPLTLKVLRVSWNNMQTYRAQILLLFRLQNLEQLDASNQEAYPTASKSGVMGDYSGNSVKNMLAISGKNKKSGHVDNGINFTKSKEGQMLALYLPPKFWMLNCSRIYKNKLTFPALEFVNSSLTYVNFAYNQINSLQGPVKGVESVRHFDLTGNDCYNVSDTFFAYMTGLKTLLLGKNRLGKNFRSEKTFYNLSALKHLDMHNNQLETLGYNLFSRLTNLTHLQLSENYLSDWKVNMSGLVRLQTLDLSHNKLRSFSWSLCQDLDRLRAFSSIQVDIKGNPFQCVCDTEHFIEWITTTKVRFRNLNSTFCTLTNGTVRSLSASRSILGYLQQDCRSYTSLIGGVCGALALVLTILLAKIFHRQRWKIRYLCYMATNWRKRTGYQSLDSVEENLFGYDVFVSYEDSLRNFIREQVIPHLETEAGLKLCIDKRDFVPGLYITDNILHAIQSSRKTVVLLSKDFLKSKWCMYELNMARMEGIYTGRELLILILTEEIPTSELSAEIIDIIHKQTYIEMTNDRYGEALFWERLVSAVKPN